MKYMYTAYIICIIHDTHVHVHVYTCGVYIHTYMYMYVRVHILSSSYGHRPGQEAS